MSELDIYKDLVPKELLNANTMDDLKLYLAREFIDRHYLDDTNYREHYLLQAWTDCVDDIMTALSHYREQIVQ